MLRIVPWNIEMQAMRLSKASVPDEVCGWDNPVYQRVKSLKRGKSVKRFIIFFPLNWKSSLSLSVVVSYFIFIK